MTSSTSVPLCRHHYYPPRALLPHQTGRAHSECQILTHLQHPATITRPSSSLTTKVVTQVEPRGPLLLHPTPFISTLSAEFTLAVAACLPSRLNKSPLLRTVCHKEHFSGSPPLTYETCFLEIQILFKFLLWSFGLYMQKRNCWTIR